MCGIEAREVQVETDISDGLPTFLMVGYLAAAVREAADRVRTAIRNSGIRIPPKRIVVNLAPADMHKEGAWFDLAIALSVLSALGELKEELLERTMVVGELSLDGSVHGVRGVLPIVMRARELGFERCIVPAENVREGQMAEGIRCVGVETLAQAVQAVRSPEASLPGGRGAAREADAGEEEERSWADGGEDYDVDFGDIRGQEGVKRAAKIAVAGMHNLLMVGPSGSGKTMIARRLPTVFPPLSREESLELSKIYSVVGELSESRPLIRRRPFRAPHHTVTAAALCGGGRIPSPGEVSLAHMGVLFLDELTEFSPAVLECLRQPMEDHVVQISRVHGTYIYPSDMMVCGAMNPCSCGYYPDMSRCTCSPREIQRFLHRISQALLDRMDICVEAPQISYRELAGGGRRTESSGEIRRAVVRAAAIQKERFRGTGIRWNSGIPGSELSRYCRMDRRAEELLQGAFEELGLSARAYHKIVRVARTIADLDGEEIIQSTHVGEAVCYRSLERRFWLR